MPLLLASTSVNFVTSTNHYKTRIMKKREPVSHIMSTHVLTLNVADSLEEAEKIMKQNRIRHIPVVSGNKLVGMLSLTDLLRISFVDNFGEQESATDTVVYDILNISQVMVSNPESVRKDSTIREVAELLATKEYHALPVTDSTGDLVGIVTTTDLIEYLIEQY